MLTKKLISAGMRFYVYAEGTDAKHALYILERRGDFIDFELQGKRLRAQIARMQGGGECLTLHGYHALFVNSADAQRAAAGAEPQGEIMEREDGDFEFNGDGVAWCALDGIPAFAGLIATREGRLRFTHALSRVRGIESRSVTFDGRRLRLYRRDLVERIAASHGNTGYCALDMLLSGEPSPSKKQSLRDLTPELLAEMERIGLTRHQVHNRLIKGWPLERAATTPIYGFGGRPAKNAHD